MIQTAKIKSTTYEANGFPFEMITVEKGSFMMGDDDSLYDEDKPAHLVTFKKDFEIGKYPVTQALWAAVMGKEHNHSRFQGADRPVEQVSWEDIVLGNKKQRLPAFLDKLNAIPAIQKLNLEESKQFRLPTEAQWEYAARGGKYWKDFNYTYAGSNHLKEVAWYSANSHRETKPVGFKMPNILGLYDMSGNVFEWCQDKWHENYKSAPTNGTAWLDKKKENIRVIRGGAWDSDVSCRVTDRLRDYPYFRIDNAGFRLSRN